MRRFVDDAWHEVTNVDSATMRTMRTMVARPGELTRAYLDGQTRRYLPPLRVYLLAFGVHMLGTSLLPDDYAIALRAKTASVQAQAAASFKAASPAAVVGVPSANRSVDAQAKKLARRKMMTDVMPKRVMETVLASSRNPWLQLLNVFPVALALSLLYRGQRRNYAEHVVMAIHLLAFNTLLLLVNELAHAAVGLPRGKLDALALVHYPLICAYIYLAARRVHEESARITAGKSVLAVAATQLSMLVVPAFVGALALVATVLQILLFMR